MPFDIMRLALGFTLMTIGAFGAVAGPVRVAHGVETGSTRRRARRFVSRFVPGRAGTLRRPSPGRRAAVQSRVQELVAEQLGVDVETVVPRVSLTDDLAADSLDLLELALVLESQFAIALPRPAVEQVRSIGDLVDAVMASLDGRERPRSRPWSVPAGADDVELGSIREEFAALGKRGVDVTVRREADL